MKTIHMNAVAALMTVITLALTGTLLGAEKLIRQGITRVPQGQRTSCDAAEFLTRYYDKGASAGSAWESLIDNVD